MNLVANKVGFSVKKTEILKGIDLRCESGQFIGILGPSGSGKSTLLRALSGRGPFTEGTVAYDGEPLEALPPHAIGFVPQDDTLHLALKTERVLSYTARLQLPDADKAQVTALVDSTLRSVGLEKRKKTRVRRLSGGQRKRVSIAMELLVNPGALYLDEPTSGLDPELEKNVMKLCRSLSRGGCLVVMTTHILESISLFDRLLFLVEGECSFFGTPKEALTFFQVDDIHHVYPLLAGKGAGKFASKYRSSKYYRAHLK